MGLKSLGSFSPFYSAYKSYCLVIFDKIITEFLISFFKNINFDLLDLKIFYLYYKSYYHLVFIKIMVLRFVAIFWMTIEKKILETKYVFNFISKNSHNDNIFVKFIWRNDFY